MKPYISSKNLETLKEARENYGYNNQILVSMEELNELACVLAKYGRYDTHEEALSKISEKVLDEVADVIVVLDHVINIFNFSEAPIISRIDSKVDRLRRWMQNNPSFQHTTEDREICTVCTDEGEHCNNFTPLDKDFLVSLNETPESIGIKVNNYCQNFCFDDTCVGCDDATKRYLDEELDRALGRL